MKENKNEELQSRREFFKSAAKAALPIIGAAVLASAPSIIQATEVTDCGKCNNRCMNFCDNTCHGGCKSHCADTCYSSCTGGCKNNCTGKNRN